MDRWQLYKNLELIVGSTSESQVSQSVIVNGLKQLWRSLLIRYIKSFSNDQQLEYLEKCIDKSVALERLAVSNWREKTIWHTVWFFLNQPIFNWNVSVLQEPQIQRISDPSGHVWWQVYDPITGQTGYLESEEEVHVWLEERLYF